ncbi:MAG: toxin-antitoxin system, antitoxin component [Candidatus Omnitrophica bacterium]|nr:toxin-antitoxin system, antitoxin component [Candidatus Omnitrophota bacterium]
MAQLTLYVDEEMIHKIETAAKREHLSISKWVKQRLDLTLHHHWPKHYFDLFGALAHETLERPGQIDFSKDRKREKM